MKYRLLSALLVLCLLILPTAALAADDEATAAADALYSLGLFQGTGTDENGSPIYALDDRPTRAEALVMLIRLLGAEDEALAGSWQTPFTDVPDTYWAASYIGYAYQNGITTGVSVDEFGLTEADTITAAQYITFLLRALGYDDSAGDFDWETSASLAASIGFSLKTDWVDDDFTRGDVALLSYAALSVTLKNSNETLYDALGLSLIQEQSTSVSTLETSVDAEFLTTYSTEDIESFCAPAVFQIMVYDETGTATSTGSGFFIDESGIAVTCYHVIHATSSATVTLSCYDGNTYPVTEVLYCDASEDIAVLQVSDVSTTGTAISSFPALELATQELAAGDPVYAIGHPNGGALAVSSGSFLSSVVADYRTYYSSDAAISPGSSGGALVNQYGQAVGITSAIYTNNTSISLSIPISVVTAHDWSGDGSAYSAESTLRSDQFVLTASDYDVTISSGSYQDITIADLFTTGAQYTCESSNGRVATCGWADSVIDPSNMTLRIYGGRSGTATVTVKLYDSEDRVLYTLTIQVAVARKTAS